MEDEAGVLQQGIQVASFGGGRQQTLERIGGEQDEYAK